MMSLKNKCPVCKEETVDVFLNRSQVPIYQNFLLADQQAAVDIARGDLQMAACSNCGFVYNTVFDPNLLKYGQTYDNAQFFSNAFNDYLDKLAAYLIDDRGVKNCRIVEVGSGDGYFLRKLVEKGNNRGVGYDPSYRGPLEEMDGRLRFEQSYYGPEQAHTQADVVICRHVIEHVPDPVELLVSVRQALINSPSAYVFFETPTVEWILKNNTFWDFFYEHCSIFTKESLTTAFQISGFQVQDVRAEFGGQYLWMEAAPSAENSVDIKFDAVQIPSLAQKFGAAEGQLKGIWHEKIRQLNVKGRVALWGAGAKGVTFANLVDPENQMIACVVDLNPRKQGHYLPGTGHPIVDFASLPLYNVKTIIVMNPNYGKEITALVENAKLDVQLIDLNDEMEK
jgi:SAM-dependent methyltransferase